MASVINIQNGDVLNFTIHKRLGLSPEVKWVNSYEVQVGPAGAVLGTNALEQVADLLANFEREFHLTAVQFDRVVVSTAPADSDPYEGDEFMSIPLNGQQGVYDPQGDMADLSVVLRVRRKTLAGRNGRLSYRGCLVEGDFNAPSGFLRLVNQGTVASRISNAVQDSGVFAILNHPVLAGDDLLARVVMFTPAEGGGQPLIRGVKALELEGIGRQKMSKRWYNRGS